MEFRILGPLEAVEGNRVVPLGGGRQRALLALLILNANEVVSTDRLVDELWGEGAPPTASKAVRNHVSSLRQALASDGRAGGDGLLVTRGSGYELRLEPGSLDLDQFERLLALGRRCLEQADRREEARGLLGEALALWRGPALAEFAFEPFAQAAIARLEERRLVALEERIAADLALGGHADLVGELEALIAKHPLRERLRGMLMLALYRSGRQSEALHVYQETRRILVDELGIEPGPALQRLERSILQQDSALELVPVPEAVVETVSSAAAFVGREAELELLLGGLQDAYAGRGRVFLLVGEPGIGKSRLADELSRRALARGARVLVGRCWEAGGAPAYWPWVQSLRSYVRESDAAALRSQLGAGAADLAQIVPELRQRFTDLPQPPKLESEGARFRLFDATAEFLRNASASRPIVLVLDDLHAADTPSLLLLQFLARELSSMRILVLGAYRDVDPLPGQPLVAMLAGLAREPVSRRVSLTGLNESDVMEYVELTASGIASAKLATALHDETEGNPLFVVETVRLLSVEGLGTDPAEPRISIPQSVKDVIARRLSHLSEECNRVLVIASVLGREFAHAALAGASRVSEDELLETLDEAMAARIISDVPGAAARLRFAHVLIRDTLYEGLTTPGRVRLHRLAVDALEMLYGGEPGPHLAELAHHSIAGSEFESGLRYARAAGDRALELLAYEEAARLYETALESLDLARPSDEATRCELLLSLGEAEARAGNTTAAKKAFLGAADSSRRHGLPRQLARAALGYGGRIVWARADEDALLVSLLEEGLAALANDDVELRIRLLARLAGALRDEHRRDRRDLLSREAVDLARGTEVPAALAYALDSRVAALIAPDTVTECLALSTELRDLSERIGDTEQLVHGHIQRLMVQLMVGEMGQAAVELDAAARIAHGLRQPAQLWLVRAAEAMIALGTGRLTQAEELIQTALAIGERAQPGWAISAYRLQRYTLCDFRGGMEELEPAISDLVVEYPARPVFRCALTHLYARLERWTEAKESLDDLARDRFAVLPFDQEWLYGISFLAETSALLGATDSAPVLYELLQPWAMFNAVDTAEGIRGSVSSYLGTLATATEHWSEARRHFDDAIEMNARMEARPWLARTHDDYARMLLLHGSPGDAERARHHQDAAALGLRELGMTPRPSVNPRA